MTDPIKFDINRHYVAVCMGYNDDDQAHHLTQRGDFFNKYPERCPLPGCDNVWEYIELLMDAENRTPF
jgi:hypothetical protein